MFDIKYFDKTIEFDEVKFYPNLLYLGNNYQSFIWNNIGFPCQQNYNCVCMDHRRVFFHQKYHALKALALEPMLLTLEIDDALPENIIKFNPFIFEYEYCPISDNHYQKQFKRIEEIIISGLSMKLNDDSYKCFHLIMEFFCFCVPAKNRTFRNLMKLLIDGKSLFDSMVSFYESLESDEKVKEVKACKDVFATFTVTLYNDLRNTFVTDKFLEVTDTTEDFFSSFWHYRKVLFIDYSENTNPMLATLFVNGLLDFTYEVSLYVNSVPKYSYYLVPDALNRFYFSCRSFENSGVVLILATDKETTKNKLKNDVNAIISEVDTELIVLKNINE